MVPTTEDQPFAFWDFEPVEAFVWNVIVQPDDPLWPCQARVFRHPWNPFGILLVDPMRQAFIDVDDVS
ncbi:hypothetical protein OKA05_15080 [Luteolibacter arcticus]|uniref:Uncharacterized protein n=1 Tax=Luteolibacter arcticus TaxID=1581411 RepID=A0ABT3GK41_9BACT|nr:hypothetical protein [Luteolibacter arcticus]MCW1923890.1 hypothetical protein [Luteolibacter arcticus]